MASTSPTNSPKKPPSPGLHATLLGKAEGNENIGKENDEGSIEYKWKLVGVTEDRLQHLVTQMQFRVAEGQGECMYEIGVADSGNPIGLEPAEYDETLGCLRKMANILKCDLTVVYEKTFEMGQGKVVRCAEVLIRKYGEENFVDMRVGVCGASNAGKSTLVGVVTRGVLDNGDGLSRQSIFKHLHEVESGRTSCISQQILGFDSHGRVVNYDNPDEAGLVSPEQIAEHSSKVLTLYDLAGHQKYLKTTMSGLASDALDYVCVVVRGDTGIQRMTKEHLGFCCSLRLPFFFVITFVDISTSQSIEKVVTQLKELCALPMIGQDVLVVNTEDDAVMSARSFKGDSGAAPTVPIFCVSNVSGSGLPLLTRFLNLLPIRRDWGASLSQPAEMIIDQTFHLESVGLVLTGLVEQGSFSIGDTLYLGPDEEGAFHPITVSGIQVKRINVRRVHAGVYAAIAVQRQGGDQPLLNSLRRGMVLVANDRPVARCRFEATISVLYVSGELKPVTQPAFHCRSIRQNVRMRIVEPKDPVKTGQTAVVECEFMFTPEYLKIGSHFLFLEGTTKGCGTITKLLEDEPRQKSPSPEPADSATTAEGGNGKKVKKRNRASRSPLPEHNSLVMSSSLPNSPTNQHLKQHTTSAQRQA